MDEGLVSTHTQPIHGFVEYVPLRTVSIRQARELMWSSQAAKKKTVKLASTKTKEPKKPRKSQPQLNLPNLSPDLLAMITKALDKL